MQVKYFIVHGTGHWVPNVNTAKVKNPWSVKISFFAEKILERFGGVG